MDEQQKGLKEFLDEDSSLKDKISYSEYKSGYVGRQGNRKEYSLEEAHSSYQQVLIEGKK